eukprot:GDKI01017418.1.p2 GENE.GDKI01017418.1~~GDKI01017418.1.p2  ORF type:complete len:105 (-),score=20.81 GDKI01017418.1:42-356(-)
MYTEFTSDHCTEIILPQCVCMHVGARLCALRRVRVWLASHIIICAWTDQRTCMHACMLPTGPSTLTHPCHLVSCCVCWQAVVVLRSPKYIPFFERCPCAFFVTR